MEHYFETICCHEGEVEHLLYHERRMAKTVGLNFNLGEYIYVPNDDWLKCKVIYSNEGISSIDFVPYSKREIQSFKFIFDDTIEYSKKSTNREVLNQLFLKRDKADEIIIVKKGLVTDTSIANIAMYDGTHWLTPKQPLLEGTTRARLLANEEIFERDITVEMLQDAKKIALLNAMIGMDVLTDYSLFL